MSPMAFVPTLLPTVAIFHHSAFAPSPNSTSSLSRSTWRPQRSRVARITRCASVHPTMTTRVASDGDSVNVHYEGYLDDGTKFDSSRDRNEPLNFVIGGGMVIRGFDDGVRGLKPGQSRRTRIEPINGYGARKDDLIVDIKRETTPANLNLTPGSRVPLSNGMMATVIEVTETHVRIDANHELAGKALTFDMELVSIEDPVLAPPAQGLERAVFGLGCFWGAELAFQRVVGVVSTKVGYSHGHVENPSYNQVCAGNTGHVEAVAVDFDPSIVSYSALVDLFWERLGLSALTLNQVGNDVGTQYRSGIYYQSEEQFAIAEASAKAAGEKLGKTVATEIVNGDDVPFYIAEAYHQQYLQKGGQSAEKGATETIRCYG